MLCIFVVVVVKCYFLFDIVILIFSHSNYLQYITRYKKQFYKMGKDVNTVLKKCRTTSVVCFVCQSLYTVNILLPL